MRITRYTDYSLRVLIYVALKQDEISTIGEIADSYGISKNHLMKVLQALHNNGYLQAVRGKNGGIYLQGLPEHINIGQLVRTTEEDFSLVECFSGGDCQLTPACKLKGVFAKALEAFFQVLDTYTLADLLTPASRRELVRLLNIAV